MQIKGYLLNLKKIDWLIFFSALLLIFFGMTAIYSVNLSIDPENLFNVKKQTIALIIGLISLFVIALGGYRYLKQISVPIYILSIVLLIGVLFFGRTIRGTTGWYSFAGIAFQPVEFAKIGLILMLSRFFSDRSRKMDKLAYVIWSGVLVGIPAFLTMLQPDFGSTLVLLFIWFSLLMISGIKKKYILVLILAGIMTAVFSWMFVFADYQKDRIMTFIDPSLDPLGSGYNITQSVIAVGSGGVFGKGLGFGSQSQLRFLPESQTDFIFAVLAEELGFIGVSFIMILLILLSYRLIVAAKNARNDFDLFIILGVLFLISIHTIINLGMNIGIMPVAGLSLPFISYGGSFLVINLILIGVVESIIISSKIIPG